LVCMHLSVLYLFEPVVGNWFYLADRSTIMRQWAERRFNIYQVKVTLSHSLSVSEFHVHSVSIELIGR
jgi:hypothetical protein